MPPCRRTYDENIEIIQINGWCMNWRNQWMVYELAANTLFAFPRALDLLSGDRRLGKAFEEQFQIPEPLSKQRDEKPQFECSHYGYSKQ